MFMQIYLRIIFLDFWRKCDQKRNFLILRNQNIEESFEKKNFAQVLNFTRGTGIPSSIKDFPYFVYIS